MKQLELRCKIIERFFEKLMSTNSRSDKDIMVNEFRENHPKLEKDLDFCFEVLAGKHKLGYTYDPLYCINTITDEYENYSIRRFVDEVLKQFRSTDVGIEMATRVTPVECRSFMASLVNRVFKLGYSNHQAMITDLSPMLAKKYPDDFSGGICFIQEKLDGNRCIAYYDEVEDCWKFQSRSGKPLKLNFDMSWANINLVYDGEVMTLSKAGTRDFNRTSGAINGKYTDKSGLHYYIYDIIRETMNYEERLEVMKGFDDTGGDCTILPVLDKVYLSKDVSENKVLDDWLDYIVDKGGEGIILRSPYEVYQHKRTSALLKYKKLKTMDLRVIGWNYGTQNGKYENDIGSLICESDDHSILVNVAGLSDDMRFSDPNLLIGLIIEVAYFDMSTSKSKDTSSLRFPRFKRIRNDKTTTSIY